MMNWKVMIGCQALLCCVNGHFSRQLLISHNNCSLDGQRNNKCHTTFIQDDVDADDAHLNLWKPKMFPHYTDTKIILAHCCGPRETNQKTAAGTKMGPFLFCSLSPPPPMHTHAYTHTCLPWQMACDVPLWTWHERVHSLSPGLTERQPRPAEGTPECLYTLDVTLSESFHLLGWGQREPTEETQQYWLRRVRCWVTAQQQLQQSSF